MNKKITFIGTLFVVLAAITVYESGLFTSANSELLVRQPISEYGQQLQMTDHRNALHQFITNKLSGPDGIYTNLQETDQKEETATGHEVLSESAGLLMRYYALTGQKDKFDQVWQQAKRTFELNSVLSYRYSPKLLKTYTMNAAVDDLRILQALNEASIAFHQISYKTESEAYGDRLYQYNVVNGSLRDFYDETYKTTNSFITLCYIDVASLEFLPISRKKKTNLEATMLQITQKGYLSDAFPFYQTRYDYTRKSYQTDTINTVESLLTILHLAEVKQAQEASLHFIKEQVKAGTLYGQYTQDGKPLNEVKSTAIYAITAMIGSVIADKELYEDSIRQMNAFQIHNPRSALDGGFGDVTSGQAYSFDNLMALLAYLY